MAVNQAYLSDQTTVLSNLSLSGNLASAAFAQFSTFSGSRITTQFVTVQSSAGTINPAFGTLMSWRTIAASALTVSAAQTNVRADEVVLVAGGASGMSIGIYSNGTVYIFSSALSAKFT